jgi:hypothetical protein
LQPKQADISAKGAEQQQQTNETIKPKQHNQANKKGGGPKNKSNRTKSQSGARTNTQKQHKHKEKTNKEAPGNTKGGRHTEETPQKGADR